MYGASIEKDFQHTKFEREQLKRNLEARSLLETGKRHQQRSLRSLLSIFGRIAPQFGLRPLAGRSQAVPR